MKNFILIFAALFMFLQLQAQQDESLEFRTTYPVDSCLYFMQPFNFRVLQKQTLSNGMDRFNVSFRTVPGSNPDLMITGEGRFLLDPLLLPGGTTISVNNVLSVTISLPETINEPNNPWSGGPLPYPIFLNGIIQKIQGDEINPPVPFVLQALQFEIISLSN